MPLHLDEIIASIWTGAERGIRRREYTPTQPSAPSNWPFPPAHFRSWKGWQKLSAPPHLEFCIRPCSKSQLKAKYFLKRPVHESAIVSAISFKKKEFKRGTRARARPLRLYIQNILFFIYIQRLRGGLFFSYINIFELRYDSDLWTYCNDISNILHTWMVC